MVKFYLLKRKQNYNQALNMKLREHLMLSGRWHSSGKRSSAQRLVTLPSHKDSVYLFIYRVYFIY